MEQAPQSLPPWGDDELSKFMSMADRNLRASAHNWPHIYEVQQGAHGLLKRIGEILEKDPADVHLGVPRFLTFRSHSAILNAMRSAMSTQSSEAYPVLRVAIEQAWYALHVAKDPATPPTRAKIWWDRHESPEAKQACKDEFQVGKVRRTHEALDPAAAAEMQKMYEHAIDFGGHPNERGVAASLRIDRSKPGEATIGVGFLHPDERAMKTALKAAVDISIGAAKTVALIYPERFRIMEVYEGIDRLVQHANAVFVRDAELLRRAS